MNNKDYFDNEASVMSELSRMENEEMDMRPGFPEGYTGSIPFLTEENAAAIKKNSEKEDSISDCENNNVCQELVMLHDAVDLQAIRTSSLFHNTRELNIAFDSFRRALDHHEYDIEELKEFAKDADERIFDACVEIAGLQDADDALADRLDDSDGEIEALSDFAQSLEEDVDETKSLLKDCCKRLSVVENKLEKLIETSAETEKRLIRLEEENVTLFDISNGNMEELEEMQRLLYVVDRYTVPEFSDKMDKALHAARMLIGLERKLDRLFPDLIS